MIYYVFVKIIRWLEHYNCYNILNRDMRSVRDTDRDDYDSVFFDIAISIENILRIANYISLTD